MVHRRIDTAPSTITMAWTFIQYPVRPGDPQDTLPQMPTT